MKEVELPQSAVVLALERNGLNMDKAVRDVFRQKMNSNGLYAYIWGELEGGGIRQKQNERVKQMIKEEDKYPDSVSNNILVFCDLILTSDRFEVFYWKEMNEELCISFLL